MDSGRGQERKIRRHRERLREREREMTANVLLSGHRIDRADNGMCHDVNFSDTKYNTLMWHGMMYYSMT